MRPSVKSIRTLLESTNSWPPFVDFPFPIVEMLIFICLGFLPTIEWNCSKENRWGCFKSQLSWVKKKSCHESRVKSRVKSWVKSCKEPSWQIILPQTFKTYLIDCFLRFNLSCHWNKEWDKESYTAAYSNYLLTCQWPLFKIWFL